VTRLITLLLAQVPPPASPEILLKTAMQAEQIDNDLPAAIAQYKNIVDKFPKDPAATRALLQLAGFTRGCCAPTLFDPGARPDRPSSISITPASGGARRTVVEGFMEDAI